MKQKLKVMLEEFGVLSGLYHFIFYCFSTFFKVYSAKFLRNIIGIKNIIVLKGQTDFEGSCRELYKHLLKMGLEKRYTIVWHIDDMNSVNTMDTSKCQVITKKNRMKSIYYNACSKFVFYETTCCFQRKVKGQVIVYLGHGCPTLKWSKDVIKLNENLTSSAVITSKSILTLMSELFQFPANKFVINGLLRNDVIIRSNMTFKSVDAKLNMKVLIWMPTFRKSNIVINNIERNDSSKDYLYGLPLVRKKEDLFEINDVLKRYNLQLLIKPHPRAAECGITEINYSNIVVWTNDYMKMHNINIYNLFKDSVGMISDYSSVVFDYMLVDKPLAYIIDDMDFYKLGFAYDNVLEYMPGNHVNTLSDLYEFFSNIAKGEDNYQKDRHRINNWANKYHDDKNVERLVRMYGINN